MGAAVSGGTITSRSEASTTFAGSIGFVERAAARGIALRPYLGYTPEWAARPGGADSDVWPLESFDGLAIRGVDLEASTPRIFRISR